ncbi:MAG TPA: patatin-like phospholipase family protein [Longimicrobiales bacterium]|nr:patatin-like phospholipase family protein [Longimicrobiales bacterium]
MRKVILVLGGGGMKGLAHVGAWKAVEEAGLEVTEIVGTSIGALVGACIAAGEGWAEMAPRALELQKRDIVSLNGRALLINGIRQESVFRAEPFRAYIERTLPAKDFSELRIPLSINAVDLEDGRTEWFGAGGRTDVALAEAVYASCALPVFFPAARIGDRCYVDGGVRSALPIERAAERGAELVVAVDVAAGEVKDSLDTLSKGMIAVQHRAFDIMAYAHRQAQLAAWAGPRLVRIRPELEGHSTFDFTQTKYFLEEGYRAARRALAPFAVPEVRRTSA